MTSVKVGHANTIAILDFAPFLDGSHKEEVAKEILESFQTVGFVYLVNHGLSQDKLSNMFEWSRRFFEQPLQIKQLAPHPDSGAYHRGYSAPGREKVHKLSSTDDQLVPSLDLETTDVKESFEVGSENDKLQSNIWLPDDCLVGFKDVCLDFYWACREVELTILRALAVGLKLPEEYFIQCHSRAENQLRLLHYPSVPADALEADEITRISAHTDFCSFTLLFQDQIGGLEVEDPNVPGLFMPVPPVDGALCLNAGDFLMRWSNDTIKSTRHRVRAPATGNTRKTKDGMTPARYSIPYFCAADMDVVVDCLPGTFSDTLPKKYKPISAGAYIMERLAANY